ncbi:MAG: hypothetical protein R3C68_08315 [Myxococcota bacterium]
MNALRKLRFTLLGVGFAMGSVGGCSCGDDTPPPTPSVSIAFTFPSDGATLDSGDDVNASENGVQINVRAQLTGLSDGTELVLTNSVDVDGAGAAIPTTALVANGEVVFSGYTLPGGQVTLRIAQAGVGASESCDGRNCDEVAVTVFDRFCVFVSPLEGQTLNEDANPDPSNPFDPFEVDVVLDCEGLTPTDNVLLRINEGLPAQASPDATGRLVFSRVALAEGVNTISAAPVLDGGAEGAPTSITVTVDSGRCTALLLPSDGATLLADDDVDVLTQGMQTALDVVSDCGSGSTVRIFAKGPGDTDFVSLFDNTTGEEPDDGGVRFHVGSVSLPESDPASTAPFDVQVVATVHSLDATRQGATLLARYRIDSVAPTMVLTNPGPSNSCLGPDNDTDAGRTGLQMTVTGQVAGANDGAEAWVRIVTTDPPACISDADCDTDGNPATDGVCRAGLCRFVGTTTGGTFTVPRVEVPVGAVTLEYIATDLAGNRTTPVLVNVSVVANNPNLVVTSPSDATVLGLAQDADTSLAGLQFDVNVTLSDIAPGSSGVLLVSNQVVSQFGFTPPAGVLGQSTRRVDFEDGVHTVTARVRNACGKNFDSPPIQVTVSSASIDLLVTAFAAGTSQAIDDGGATATDTVDLDIFTKKGTATRTVTVDITDSVSIDGAGVRTCDGTPLGSQLTDTVLANADGVIITGVSLAAGVNCLAIRSDDGSNAVDRVYVIERRVSARQPSISVPAPPVVWTGADDTQPAVPGFNQSVQVVLDSPDNVPGTMFLRMLQGAAVIGEVSRSVISGVAVVSFTDISLPQGQYDLVATYQDAFGLSADSAAVSIDVNVAGEQIAITAPTDGARLSDANFQLTVTDLDTGSAPTTCELFVNNVGQGSTAWSGGASMVFDPVLGDGTFDLRVQCDGAAGIGTSQSISVSIDNTPSTSPVSFVNEPAGTPGQIIFQNQAFVNGQVPDTSSLPGLQHDVLIDVVSGTESPRDWVVELTVTPPGAAAQVRTQTISESVGPVRVRFASVDFGTQAEGSLLLSALVRDNAGNPSAPNTVTLQKDVQAPTLTQQIPSPSLMEITRAHDVNQNTPDVDIIFGFNVQGAVQGIDCAVNPELCLSIEVSPIPLNKTVSDFPLRTPIVSGTTSFETLTFADGVYSATIRARDAAGNSVTLAYNNFVVEAVKPKVNIDVPVGPSLNGSFNRTFALSAVGFAPGSTISLCSSVVHPSITNPQPCEWGDGVEGGPTRALS